MAVAGYWERKRLRVQNAVLTKGRPFTLIQDQGPDDPSDPLGPAKSPVEVQTYGIFVRPSGWIKLGESFYIDPGLWQEAEKIALVLPSLTYDFARFNRAKDEGESYKIFKIEELKPGPIPLLLYIGMKT